jgi:hypothetical protein
VLAHHPATTRRGVALPTSGLAFHAGEDGAIRAGGTDTRDGGQFEHQRLYLGRGTSADCTAVINAPDPVVTELEEAAAWQLANFSIGFCRFTTSGRVEDATSAGSGTLARIGPVGGVLTAGHVLRNLPTKGRVGLVRFRQHRTTALQTFTIDMQYVDQLTIWSGEESEAGPDIGFLRLPLPEITTLAATKQFHQSRGHVVLDGPT